MLLNSMENTLWVRWTLGHPPTVPVSSKACPPFAAPGGEGWLRRPAHGARRRALGSTVRATDDVGGKKTLSPVFLRKELPFGV